MKVTIINVGWNTNNGKNTTINQECYKYKGSGGGGIK